MHRRPTVLFSLAVLAVLQAADTPIPPAAEHLRQVRFYHEFAYRNAETPFELQPPQLVPADLIPSSERLRAIAREHRAVIEVCAPLREGHDGEWRWPEDTLPARRFQCSAYGEPTETLRRQP